MSDFDPAQVRAASLTPRWAALSQLGGVAADLDNFDPFLVREPRLLVPIDVQAMVVRAGANDAEPMIRLPWRDGRTELPPLDVHDAGTPRAPGVHLLWSPPAALGRGTLVDDPAAPGDASRQRLQLPVLPDRWVVLRVAVPSGQRDPLVTGWVLEADSGTVTALADWPSGSPQQLVDPVPAGRLTMHSGGTAWTQEYDAALGRFSFYDDLSDLAQQQVQVEGDALSYLVAGWWSVTANDPLDGVGTDAGYRSRLQDLGWNDPDHPSPDSEQRATADRRYSVANTFGLAAAQRYSQPLQLSGANAAAADASPRPVSPVGRILQPTVSGFLQDVIAASALPPAPTRSTLLHGRIHGVPLGGAPEPDSRPAKEGLRVVLGASTPDLAATLSVSGTGMGAADQDSRRDAERLLTAFASGDLVRIGQSDVWSDVDEYEHAHGFVSLPGGTEGVDRFVDKPAPTADPGAGARPTRTGPVAPKAQVVAETAILWSAVERPHLLRAERAVSREFSAFDGPSFTVPPPAPAVVREVSRPAPAYHQPAASVLGIAGGGRVLSAVEREEADAKLVCRLSDQVSRGHAGVLAGSELLTTLGTAAVPSEVLDLAREALAEDPFLTSWRASRAKVNGLDGDLAFARFRSEAAVAHAYYTADDDRLSSYVAAPVTSSVSRQKATEGLLRSSVSDGVWSHPEGVTMWGQPWRPLFCDWEVTLELGPNSGWQLVGNDLEYAGAEPLPGPDVLVFHGRSPLVAGAAQTIAAGLSRWLDEERQRDLGGHGLADPSTETALSALRDSLTRIDLLSVALDGVREQLLGLSYDRGLLHKDSDAAPDGSRQAVVDALPRLLAAGLLELTAARLVDAFGRCVDLPLDTLLVPERLAHGDDRTMLSRLRISAPARWHFDLVDATSTAADAALARIDQADPTQQVTPVAGFLLPDHMDESLEVFAADGRPLGELSHDAFSDAVTWEIAPGRTDVAPAAGPTDDPDVAHHRVAWIAAGLVASDATARQGTPDRPETESALSAMLRAIDTTLWSVDPYGSLGTEHIAGLVGRPIAVVNARLSLDVQPDVEGRVYADAGSGDALKPGRQAAYDALVEQSFEVRLGEVTRSDDGLLGYFVDDDFSVFHLVDRVIAEEALPSGRCRGLLDPDGTDPTKPDPIDPKHPYINADGSIRIRPGQTVRLTLLMHPGGKVHLSSGILPRTSQSLARDWVQPGLAVLAPSLRSGPLLIDADKVRLPKVASFPAEQLFTHRDTPASWQDDPILAATQAALLPDTRPEVQEGWVRVAPNPPAPDATSG